MRTFQIKNSLKLGAIKLSKGFHYNTVLVLIVVMAFILGIYKLDEVPPALYIDEVWGVYNPFLNSQGLLELSWRSIVMYFLNGNFFTYSVFGPSAFFTRLPIVVYGTLLVILTYILGKEMFSRNVGIVSSVFMAISPWAVHFSRYAIQSMVYVFYFTLALYFLFKSCRLNGIATEIHFLVGCFILGLTFNTHIMSLYFIPLFLIGYLTLNREFIKKIRNKTMCVGAFLLAFFPTLYNTVLGFGTKKGVETLFVAYSTLSHSTGALDFFRMVFERAYLHLSPDFLAFTGGSSFVGEPWSARITDFMLLQYSTTKVGLLNYYGLIVYPALLYILYRIIKNKAKKEEKLLLWWVTAYSLASGMAYYDNPNAARNIIGLPAFVFIMAVFVVEISKPLHCRSSSKHINRKLERSLRILAVVVICFSMLSSTTLYLNDYYNTYPVRAARNFNYGYKALANFLTGEKLWDRSIYIHAVGSEWYGDQLLSFYSPIQPAKQIVKADAIEWSKELQLREAGSLFVTPFLSDLDKLEQYGVLFNVLGQVHYPDGTSAFLILELKVPEKEKQYQLADNFMLKNGYEEDPSDISGWKIGRQPEGLSLSTQDINGTLILRSTYTGEKEKEWWYICKEFQNPLDVSEFSLFKVDWNFSKTSDTDSVFIQFLLETKSGTKVWTSDLRLIYPTSSYNLFEVQGFYKGTRVLGIMVGGETSKGGETQTQIRRFQFYKIYGLGLYGKLSINTSLSGNSKFNFIDITNDGKLYVTHGTKLEIEIPIEKITQHRFVVLNIQPLRSDMNNLRVEFYEKSENIIITKDFKLIKWDLDYPQIIVVDLGELQKRVNVAEGKILYMNIQSDSDILLNGIYISDA